MCCLQADTYCISLVFSVLMHPVSCSFFRSTDQPVINFSCQSLCTLSSHWWISPFICFSDLQCFFCVCTVYLNVFLCLRDRPVPQQPRGPHLQERWGQVEQDPWAEGAQWAGDRWDTVTHSKTRWWICGNGNAFPHCRYCKIFTCLLRFQLSCPNNTK